MMSIEKLSGSPVRVPETAPTSFLAQVADHFVELARGGKTFGSLETNSSGTFFRPGVDLAQKLQTLGQGKGFHLKIKLPEGTDLSGVPRWTPGSGRGQPDGQLYIDGRTGKPAFFIGKETMAGATKSLDPIKLGGLPVGTKIGSTAVAW
jgi:hypothetical protein